MLRLDGAQTISLLDKYNFTEKFNRPQIFAGIDELFRKEDEQIPMTAQHSPPLLVLLGFRAPSLLGIVIAFATKSWYGCGLDPPKT